MNMCRICLESKADKDINELQTDVNEDNKTSFDIILFCLDIQIPQDSKISTKLCLQCYKKVLDFYEFKKLALKSDCYLNSVNVKCLNESKNEVFLREEDIKSEVSSLCSQKSNNDFEYYVEIKKEVDAEEEAVKEDLKEEDARSSQSDDNDDDDDYDVEEDEEDDDNDNKLLSVVKEVNYEHSIQESEGNEKTNVPKKRVRTKKDYVCKECGKTVRNLKEHLLQHQPFSDRKRVQCKVCDKTFTSNSARYRHHKFKHLGIKYHCDECNKDVVSLKQHRLVVHNSVALPYGCEQCDRRFISQSVLEAHMILHNKDQPFECALCQKKFRTKVTLRQHKRRIHDQEKPHRCQYCSKRFFKKYHLQAHLRIRGRPSTMDNEERLDRKPYFKEKLDGSSKNYSRQSHTKEKPFKCNECDKFFASRTSLKNHMFIHSEVKMFACKLCEMTFSKPGYLRNHMVSHTNERRYSCKYCGVRFGRSDHCRRHERTTHERHQTTDGAEGKDSSRTESNDTLETKSNITLGTEDNDTLTT